MNPYYFGNVPIPGSYGPPDKIWLFEDFVYPTSAASTLTGGWRSTQSTNDLLDEFGGVQSVVDANGVGGGCFQINHSPFSMPARGKRLYYETRLRLLDSDGVVIYFGLTNDDQTPAGGVTNGLGFTKAAATAVDVIVDVTIGGSATQTTTTVDYTDSVYATYAVEVIGETAARFYINGTLVHQTSTLPAVDTLLRPNYGTAQDAGAADGFAIDYVLVLQDR